MRMLMGAFILAALLPVLNGCRERTEAQAEAAEALVVSPARVEKVESEGYVELTGSLAGGRSVALSTKLMSQITTLSIREGERVKAGQTLVVLDDSDIAAMRSEAAAYRAEATAGLAEVETVVAQGESAKAGAAARVKQAEAVLAESQRELERTERLIAEGTIARVQGDKARLAVKVAEEGLNQAKSAVEQADASVAQARSRTPQVEAKQAQATAKDQQAAALQEYAVLKAPFDGVVTRRYFEPGQLAIPGQPILLLEDGEAFKVELNIPEELAAAQSVGSSLSILLDTADGIATELSGTLSVLGAAADPASHVVPAEVTLPATAGLMSGRFVRVRVPSGKRTQILVPASALVLDGDQAYVWRISPENLAARVPVEAGESSGGRVEILRGLSEGDTVIERPGPELYPGVKVLAGGSSEGAK